MSTVEDDDFLDGCCDLDFEMGDPTPDELLPWVVLFASFIDGDSHVVDRDGLEVRAAEWRVLFGEP